jgi:hypothetical protein
MCPLHEQELHGTQTNYARIEARPRTLGSGPRTCFADPAMRFELLLFQFVPLGILQVGEHFREVVVVEVHVVVGQFFVV